MIARNLRPVSCVVGVLLAFVLATGLVRTTVLAQQAATPAMASPAASDDPVTAAQIAAGLPGTVIAVARDGETPRITASGVADLDANTPIAAGDRFKIYSLTKTFVAVVVLQMVEEGAFALDDTIADVLSDPAVQAIPNVERITLRQLLNHTSGVYDYFDDASPFFDDAFFGPTADWSRVWTPQELLAYAAADQQAPYFAPGEGVHYSNTNYILLGLAIEAVTGDRLADVLDSHILAPLDLNDTSFTPEIANGGATVHGYQLIDGENVDVSELNTSWAWTAGGMVSTAADVLTFGQALFTGQLLDPASYAEMTAFSPDGEGMGLYGGETAIGEIVANEGNSAGFTAFLVRVPAESITLVLLTNTGTPETDPNTVVIAALQEKLEG